MELLLLLQIFVYVWRRRPAGPAWFVCIFQHKFRAKHSLICQSLASGSCVCEWNQEAMWRGLTGLQLAWPPRACLFDCLVKSTEGPRGASSLARSSCGSHTVFFLFLFFVWERPVGLGPDLELFTVYNPPTLFYAPLLELILINFLAYFKSTYLASSLFKLIELFLLC
jgi:hypothetical protein